MFTCAIRALAEEEKIIRFMNTDWLVDMHTLRYNTLRGTNLDEEVMENIRNDNIMSPLLIDSFWCLFPTLADEHERCITDAATEQHKEDGVKVSRTLNEHTIEDDSCVKEGFE